MKCKGCGAELPEDSKKCSQCGRPVIRIQPKSICGNCGTEVPRGSTTCPGCHKRVARREFPIPEELSREKERSVPIRELYAWSQAVLPVVLSLAYFMLRAAEEPRERLISTLVIFIGFTLLFGVMDLSALERQLSEKKIALEPALRLELVCCPLTGLWKRRCLPGANPKALYPHVHGILLLIYAYIITAGGALQLLLYT